MKLLLFAGLGLAVAAIANPVVADPVGRGPGVHPPGKEQRSRSGTQRGAEKSVPQRETRPQGAADRGRMNQDERRQLRRDIQDAGKDIYQRERQSPGNEQRR